MAQVFTMPQLGSTMEEGLIVRWHKQEGDLVKKGDALLEIETDKATMDVEAPADGVIHKILAQADASVPVLHPIAILGEPGDDVAPVLAGLGLGTATTPPDRSEPVPLASASAPTEAPQRLTGGSTEVYLSPRARQAAREAHIDVVALAGLGTGPDGRVLERDVVAYASTAGARAAVVAETVDRSPARLTPLAARIADDLGVDVQDLALGLPGSRVRSEDVLRHVRTARTEPEAVAPIPEPRAVEPISAGPAVAANYTVTPFAGMRRRIADNVAKSAFTAPHVTLTLEVDMTACADLRKQLLPDVERSYGVRLSYTDLLVKAVARALGEHPRVNSVLAGDEIRTYQTMNIGIAVALEEGLVVPVVKHAETKSVGAIAAELKPLIERARTGKFTPEDVSGGTFSITNLGAFGIDVFDPILVPGQAAILGVGRIAEKPVVVAGQLAVRTMMNLCLSFDHRLLDGAPAARFLQRLKELLETPLLILI